jgi:ammonia channel protein AmtB
MRAAADPTWQTLMSLVPGEADKGVPVVLRIDDPIGAVPVHLVCGIWGTLSLGLFATGQFGLPSPTGMELGLGVCGDSLCARHGCATTCRHSSAQIAQMKYFDVVRPTTTSRDAGSRTPRKE